MSASPEKSELLRKKAYAYRPRKFLGMANDIQSHEFGASIRAENSHRNIEFFCPSFLKFSLLALERYKDRKTKALDSEFRL